MRTVIKTPADIVGTPRRFFPPGAIALVPGTSAKNKSNPNQRLEKHAEMASRLHG
jgi:hypothetical protein